MREVACDRDGVPHPAAPRSRMGLGSSSPSPTPTGFAGAIEVPSLEAFDDTVFYATFSFLTAGWVFSAEKVFLSLNSSCLPLFQFLTGR